jgi:hypothetical protein
MKKECLLALGLIILARVPYALALDCGAPPQQFTNNVDVEGKAHAEGLLKKLFDGSMEGKVSVIAQDLLSKYPNSDRTVIALGLLSMYCQLIGESSANEHQKLEMLGKANEELLKWMTTAPRSEDAASRLLSAIHELSNFPNGPENTRPPTLIQAMFTDQLPYKLFVLLEAYNEPQIRAVGTAGDTLYQFKKDYYNFQSQLAGWENYFTTHIGELVEVRFRDAWAIYLRYIILRATGWSERRIEGHGNFLNYGITWDDAERVYTELQKDPEFVADIGKILTAQRAFSDEAKRAIS